ncbi:hypothetical protein PAMP_021884 [Pampus punctatissimus]
MQPPCSLQLGPCGPSPSLGSQGSAANLQRLEEKQLFEKFWKGTFKAVATPRPESVIVASITARRRVTEEERRSSLALCRGSSGMLTTEREMMPTPQAGIGVIAKMDSHLILIPA